MTVTFGNRFLTYVPFNDFQTVFVAINSQLATEKSRFSVNTLPTPNTLFSFLASRFLHFGPISLVKHLSS